MSYVGRTKKKKVLQVFRTRGSRTLSYFLGVDAFSAFIQFDNCTRLLKPKVALRRSTGQTDRHNARHTDRQTNRSMSFDHPQSSPRCCCVVASLWPRLSTTPGHDHHDNYNDNNQ